MTGGRVIRTFIFLLALVPVIVVLAYQAYASPGLRVEPAEFKTLDKTTAEQLSHTKQAIEALAKLHKLIDEGLVKIGDEDKTYLLEKLSSLESQLREQFEEAISHHVEPLRAKATITNHGQERFAVESLKMLYFGLAEYPGGPIDKSGGEIITEEVQVSPSPPFWVQAEERISVLITFPVDTRLFLETQIESVTGDRQTARMGQYRIRAKLSNGVDISHDFSLEARFADGKLMGDRETLATSTVVK